MTTSIDRAAELTLEQVLFLQEAVAARSALATASRLGVLARLATGPADPLTIARDCGIAERGARLLLGALAGLGLIGPASDGSFGAAHDLAGLAALVEPWDHLDEAVRHDRGPAAADTVVGAEAVYPTVVPQLGAMFAPAAEIAANLLTAPALRVLDAGAGAAPWSLALARRDPACRITAVDLPMVLEVTRRAVAAAGCDAQFTYLAGDLFTIHLRRGSYDLAIIANVCHLFDETANRRLLRRLFRAIRPGGTLAIVDVLPNERLDGPRSAVLYALGLLLRTSRGQAYPFSTYAGWLRSTGYETVERTDLGASLPLSLITARRPASS